MDLEFVPERYRTRIREVWGNLDHDVDKDPLSGGEAFVRFWDTKCVRVDGALTLAEVEALGQIMIMMENGADDGTSE